VLIGINASYNSDQNDRQPATLRSGSTVPRRLKPPGATGHWSGTVIQAPPHGASRPRRDRAARWFVPSWHPLAEALQTQRLHR